MVVAAAAAARRAAAAADRDANAAALAVEAAAALPDEGPDHELNVDIDVGLEEVLDANEPAPALLAVEAYADVVANIRKERDIFSVDLPVLTKHINAYAVGKGLNAVQIIADEVLNAGQLEREHEGATDPKTIKENMMRRDIKIHEMLAKAAKAVTGYQFAGQCPSVLAFLGTSSMTSTGSMIAHMALMRQHVSKEKGHDVPLLLILDHAPCHCTPSFRRWCFDNLISLLYVPKRGTPLLQPLDLDINITIRASMRRWWLHDVLLAAKHGKVAPGVSIKASFMHERLAKTLRAMREVRPEQVINAFRKALGFDISHMFAINKDFSACGRAAEANMQIGPTTTLFKVGQQTIDITNSVNTHHSYNKTRGLLGLVPSK